MKTVKINTIIGEGPRVFIGTCPNLDYTEVVLGKDENDAKHHFVTAMAFKFVESQSDPELNAFIDEFIHNTGEPWYMKEIGTFQESKDKQCFCGKSDYGMICDGTNGGQKCRE